jgi:outer membrane usher protein
VGVTDSRAPARNSAGAPGKREDDARVVALWLLLGLGLSGSVSLGAGADDPPAPPPPAGTGDSSMAAAATLAAGSDEVPPLTRAIEDNAPPVPSTETQDPPPAAVIDGRPARLRRLGVRNPVEARRPTPTEPPPVAAPAAPPSPAPPPATGGARSPSQPAILDLVLNHRHTGEVNVLLRDGDVLVSVEDLDAAGVVAFAGRTDQAFGKKAVSLRSLAPAVTYTVDEDGLALQVEVPVRMLRATTVDATRVAPAGIEQRRDASGFLNYAFHLTTPLELDAYFEAGINVDGNLLQTSVTATSLGTVVRGISSLTVDDPVNMRRWTVGETVVGDGALGAGLVTAGFTVAKTFSLNPYFVSAPTLGYTGSTTVPSIVDVYVNGVLVKSQVIPPGPFQVQNVQVPAGSGEVRYVVRDVFGGQQAVASPYYQAARNLAKGLSEYTYSIGARRLGLGAASFDFGAIGLLAYHRYGFTDRLTAGARLEAAVGMASGGAAATLTFPVGQLDAEVGASAANQGSGVAGLLGYTFVSRRFSGGINVRAVTDAYSTLSLAPTDDRQRVQISAGTSVVLGPRVGLSSQYAFALDRDLGTSVRAGLSSSVQVTRSLSLSGALGRSYTALQGAATDAFLGLTLSLGDNASLSAGARIDPGGSREAYLDVSKTLTSANGVGGRVYAVAGADPSALATGQYQGTYGRYQATLQTSSAGPGASLDAAGAIVVVRGAGILATRPVQDGFAVIQVPGAEGVRGFLNNNEIGRTDHDGNLVIPGLLSYYGNRIGIADTDLALDRSVGAVERTVSPSYRGGALVLFDAKVSHFFRGRVVVKADGKTLPASYGEMSVLTPAGAVTSPLGNEGEFELSDLPPGKHPTTVTYAGGTCTFALDVPRAPRVVTDLGERRCGQGN